MKGKLTQNALGQTFYTNISRVELGWGSALAQMLRYNGELKFAYLQ